MKAAKPERYPVGVWMVAALNLLLGGLFALLVPVNLQAQVTPEWRAFHWFYNVFSILTPALLLAVALSLFDRRLSLALFLQRAAFYTLVIRSVALIGFSFCDRSAALAFLSGVFLLLPATLVCWCVWYLVGVENARRANR